MSQNQPGDDTGRHDQAPPSGEHPPRCPRIVALGASAGGLEALEEFFAAVPADMGLAFVVVQHLGDGPVLLDELLRPRVGMPVQVAVEGMKIEPDQVYVVPPRPPFCLRDGAFAVQVRSGVEQRTSIDGFFRSLAQEQHERAIAIVLSGYGSDGTMGLRDIKEKGGLALVQDPESARSPSMPRNALGTGIADFIGPPSAMPAWLEEYLRHPLAGNSEGCEQGDGAPDGEDMDRIFTQLRKRTGHDFAHYKRNTIRRRIARRMAVVHAASPKDYFQTLEGDPLEADRLFRELLISVTSFFRDPDAFDELGRVLIDHLLPNHAPGKPIRAWVPACATGEEAYSLAILLHECVARRGFDVPIRVFATDIDTHALNVARTGAYSPGLIEDLSEERLNRFFVRTPTACLVTKELRESLIFAEQNVIRDAPFSHLDLISCRNLLIYLGVSLQRKILPIFHYALNPDGVLFLGSSETVGEFTSLFTPLDRKWKIFARRGGAASHLRDRGEFLPAVAQPARGAPAEWSQESGNQDVSRQADSALLRHVTPPCVLVNEKGDILHFHGRTGKYLEPTGGRPRMNVLEMAREGLQLDLTTALRRAATERVVCAQRNVRVKTNGGHQRVHLRVVPLFEPEALKGMLLVVFDEAVDADEGTDRRRRRAREDDSRAATLERELIAARENLQTTIEELQTSNEELRATNEELQSSNEELASANEELETSREELQSVNEELITVNAELQDKIEQLSQAHDDMSNFLANSGVGTLFLSDDLRIKRFTASAARLLNLIESDIGRPIGQLASNMDYPDLVDDARAVLHHLVPREREVQAKDGSWFEIRIVPYRSSQNVIQGVVMTFADITRFRKQIDALRAQASDDGAA